MRRERGDDDLDGELPSRLDAEGPEQRALLERLSAKWRRLEGEALNLAATMRQKPKTS